MIFTNLTPVMRCEMKMNVLNFGMKRSKFNVIVE